MKKSIEIPIHLFFWILFTSFVLMLCNVFLEAKPDAPFAGHLFYVVFLELIIGLVFFYVTFFGIPWSRKNKSNPIVLVVVLLFLLIFFALPAMKCGLWQVMSSIIPHIIVIFLAFIFRIFSDSIKLKQV